MNDRDKISDEPGRNNDLVDFLGVTEEAFSGAYAEIRRKLIRFFVYRGCSDYEELVNTTILRVLESCARVADSYVGDPLMWIYGVARNVYLESIRQPALPLPMPEPDPPELKEARFECLHRCMDEKLANGNRRLILEYYRGEGGWKIHHRKELAEMLDIEESALRLRVHRIRNKLRGCVVNCLDVLGMS